MAVAFARDAATPPRSPLPSPLLLMLRWSVPPLAGHGPAGPEPALQELHARAVVESRGGV